MKLHALNVNPALFLPTDRPRPMAALDNNYQPGVVARGSISPAAVLTTKAVVMNETDEERSRGNAYWKLGGAGIYDVALHGHFALFHLLLGILDLLLEYNLKKRFIWAVQRPDYFHLNACSRWAPLLQAWITTFQNARLTPGRGLWKPGGRYECSKSKMVAGMDWVWPPERRPFPIQIHFSIREEY